MMVDQGAVASSEQFSADAIVDACCGSIAIEKVSTVRPIHFSAKRFLENDDSFLSSSLEREVEIVITSAYILPSLLRFPSC